MSDLICSICGKSFNLKSSYSNHIKWCKEKETVIVKCENCGKEHDGSFGSGRFCCKACANTRSHSEETRLRCSNTFKQTLARIEQEGRSCITCNAIFHSKDLNRKQCFNCLPKTIVYANKKNADKEPDSILELSKRTAIKILRRMNLSCSCCGFYIEGVSLDLHHIIPRASGGKDDMSNLTYICTNCHRLAHTDISLLKNPLISIEKQLEILNINWKDFYYVK